MPRAPRVAIVGGGIGGLAAALALEHRGAETIVCEQTPNLSEIGAGLNTTPNAVKALRALGVEDQVNAVACDTNFLNIRSWDTGRYHFTHAAQRLQRKIRRAQSGAAPRRPAGDPRRRAQDH